MGAVQAKQVDRLRTELGRLHDRLDELDPANGGFRSMASKVIAATYDLIDAERQREQQTQARLSLLIRRIAGATQLGLILFGVPVVAGVFSRWWLVLLVGQLCVAGSGWLDEDTAPAQLQGQRLVAATLFATTAAAACLVIALQPAAWVVGAVIAVAMISGALWVGGFHPTVSQRLVDAIDETR